MDGWMYGGRPSLTNSYLPTYNAAGCCVLWFSAPHSDAALRATAE